MSDFVAALRERLLIGDGAMGTMLHAAGNSLDRALPELNLSKPDLVSTVHDSYLGAGVDLILTNTFGASRLRLAEHGYPDEVTAINLAGVRLARQAADATAREVFVGGSVAPAVSANRRAQVSAVDRVEAIREQIAALAEGRVDLLVLETFGYLDELVEAARIATELTDLPVIAQATFTPQGRTLGGETPHEVATALAELPIAALGANCTVGPQRMLGIVADLRAATSLPISAQPNAGLPRRVGERRFEYRLDHEYFVRYARSCVDAGAAIVGGCCGTTPSHLRAVVAALSRRQVSARPVSTPRSASNGFARALSRRASVAAQIAPPAGGSADEATALGRQLRSDGVELVLVSAERGAHAQLASTSLALHLQQEAEIQTIATVTTWDKTIMSLQADLLGAHAFGMRIVLCETGSPPLRGDYPNADGIWEVDSIGLIGLLAGLNEGRDCNGLPLATKTSFHIGARCAPGAEDLDAEIARTRLKIAAGAQFLITHPTYELDRLRRLRAALQPEGVPIVLTVSALSGHAEAEYLAYEAPDVTIPPETLASLATAGVDERETGARLATDLIRSARTVADGVVIVVGEDHETARRLLAAALTHER